MRRRQGLALMLAMVLLTGCGQRGPLTLPARVAEAAPSAGAEPQAADEQQATDEERAADEEQETDEDEE